MYSVYVVSAVLFLDIRSAYYAICRDAMTQKSETLEEFSESVACVTVLNCGFVYNLRVRVVCATALELHIHSWLLIAIDLMFMIGKHDEIEPSWADSAQNAKKTISLLQQINDSPPSLHRPTNRPSKNTGIDAASAWASKSSIETIDMNEQWIME